MSLSIPSLNAFPANLSFFVPLPASSFGTTGPSPPGPQPFITSISGWYQPALQAASHLLPTALTSTAKPHCPVPRDLCLPTRYGIARVGTSEAATTTALDPDLNLMVKGTWPRTRSWSTEKRRKDAEQEEALAQAKTHFSHSGAQSGVPCECCRADVWGTAMAELPYGTQHCQTWAGHLPMGLFQAGACPAGQGPALCSSQIYLYLYLCIWKLPFMPHKQFCPNIKLSHPLKNKSEAAASTHHKALSAACLYLLASVGIAPHAVGPPYPGRGEGVPSGTPHGTLTSLRWHHWQIPQRTMVTLRLTVMMAETRRTSREGAPMGKQSRASA